MRGQSLQGVCVLSWSPSVCEEECHLLSSSKVKHPFSRSNQPHKWNEVTASEAHSQWNNTRGLQRCVACDWLRAICCYNEFQNPRDGLCREEKKKNESGWEGDKKMEAELWDRRIVRCVCGDSSSGSLLYSNEMLSGTWPQEFVQDDIINMCLSLEPNTKDRWEVQDTVQSLGNNCFHTAQPAVIPFFALQPPSQPSCVSGVHLSACKGAVI